MQKEISYPQDSRIINQCGIQQRLHLCPFREFPLVPLETVGQKLARAVDHYLKSIQLWRLANAQAEGES